MRKQRKITGLLILLVLMAGWAINIYAASAAVLNYQDPNGYGFMVCGNQAYSASPRARGYTQFRQSDYPIYYRSYVRVTIYDRNNNVDRAAETYARGNSMADLTIRATSASKAYFVRTVHNVDKRDSNFNFRRYITSKYLTSYF